MEQRKYHQLRLFVGLPKLPVKLRATYDYEIETKLINTFVKTSIYIMNE